MTASPERRQRPAEMPITSTLNVALVAVVFAAATGLLWLASHAQAWYLTVLAGVLFSYVLLTNYALLHEASHRNLHSDERVNYLLGVVTGLLFPMPFSMIHVTHQGHHLRNRTDHEMFDMYYPTDNRLLRVLQWYSILCGLFWPVIPLGALLFAVCPRVLRTRLFQRERSSSYLLGDIRNAEVNWIRLEVALIVGWFALAFWLLALDWRAVLICYACFSFNWSTRQYIGHAFSKRDVIEGAWNLKHNGLMTWVLLHGEYDLNHHRRPEVPWFYLPRVSPADEPRPSYVWQYWRQWLGPRAATEPAPESLQKLPLSVHE
ncbi:MAG TPA: fatty acid desaturase [Pirellulaceae bacterium]|nr:fatty acid desaturase [Pirellulaceae bacterium]